MEAQILEDEGAALDELMTIGLISRTECDFETYDVLVDLHCAKMYGIECCKRSKRRAGLGRRAISLWGEVGDESVILTTVLSQVEPINQTNQSKTQWVFLLVGTNIF